MDYDHENDASAPEQLDTELLRHHGHGHNDISHLISIPISHEEIEAATKLDHVNWSLEQAKQHPKNKGGLEFEYAEHSYLGDALTLVWDDGRSHVARDKPFTLSNGLQLTYGQINGLAGDFYATINAISDGKDLQDQRKRFLRAWYWLAEDKTRNPSEAQKILSLLSKEVEMVQEALNEGKDPSAVYPNIPDFTADFELLTVMRSPECPSYLTRKEKRFPETN